MKMKQMKHSFSFFLCVMLIVAMALFTNGCNEKKAEIPAPVDEQMTVVGEGETVFPFTVVMLDGTTQHFEVHTDAKIVGEALLELGLIDGDVEQYGLYVKEVNGCPLDYDKDGAYWAFYVDGTYAVSGVDTTEIKEGKTYSFRAEKS